MWDGNGYSREGENIKGEQWKRDYKLNTARISFLNFYKTELISPGPARWANHDC